MLPTLRALDPDSRRLSTLVDLLSDQFGLLESEKLELLPTGRQTRMSNRIGWAVTYLHKAGLLQRIGRGEYRATEDGRALLRNAPSRITVSFLTQAYPQIKEFRSGGGLAERTIQTETATMETPTPETPDDAIDGAVAAIEAKVRDDLLAKLLEVSPAFFEKVVVDLLLAMGYGDAAEDADQTIGGSGDGGVDGVIREDRLGLDLIYIQAKRYRDAAVSADNLRSFAGALDDRGARKGVFITTSRFTADAARFAERQQMKRIVLIDGERLTRLMLRHDVGVRAARSITLKRLDLDYFDPDEAT